MTVKTRKNNREITPDNPRGAGRPRCEKTAIARYRLPISIFTLIKEKGGRAYIEQLVKNDN